MCPSESTVAGLLSSDSPQYRHFTASIFIVSVQKGHFFVSLSMRNLSEDNSAETCRSTLSPKFCFFLFYGGKI